MKTGPSPSQLFELLIKMAMPLPCKLSLLSVVVKQKAPSPWWLLIAIIVIFVAAELLGLGAVQNEG